MFIAHAPSGYLLATLVADRARSLPVPASVAVAAGVLGALAPDFDMLWFHLVDARQTHHHKYISHWPVLWLSLLALAMMWRRTRPASAGAAVPGIFAACGLLHMVLDSVVGDIWWFAPFVDRPFALFTVPARYKPWWLNFLLHWSFALELAICGWALMAFRRSRQGADPPDRQDRSERRAHQPAFGADRCTIDHRGDHGADFRRVDQPRDQRHMPDFHDRPMAKR